MINFLDLKGINGRYRQELVEAASRVIDSGWYINGVELKNFEKEYATYADVKHVIGVGNGLDALRLIFKALKLQNRLQAGDEVIIPANTFIATALAATDCDLNIVCADIDPETYLLTPDSVKKVLTESTRVVCAVHLYGQVCAMPELARLCEENGVLLVEDAAQSHGALTRDGKGVCSHSVAAGVSFFPGKNLGALGDAGAVLTNEPELADTIRMLRNYGSKIKYEHELQGVNSRLDEMQAAFLSVKMQHYPEELDVRRHVAQRYLDEIDNPLICLPKVDNWQGHVWHLFVVNVGGGRDAFQQYMEENGISTLIHYPHLVQNQQAYPELAAYTENAEVLEDNIVSLPIGPHLTDDEISRIVQAVNEFS